MKPNFEVVYQGELSALATHIKSGYQIQMDAPVDNHGKGASFSPTDLLCVSLAGCMIITMGIKAKDAKINLDNTKILIQKIMKQEPRRVGGINIESPPTTPF